MQDDCDRPDPKLPEAQSRPLPDRTLTAKAWSPSECSVIGDMRLRWRPRTKITCRPPSTSLRMPVSGVRPGSIPGSHRTSKLGLSWPPVINTTQRKACSPNWLLDCGQSWLPASLSHHLVRSSHSLLLHRGRPYLPSRRVMASPARRYEPCPPSREGLSSPSHKEVPSPNRPHWPS